MVRLFAKNTYIITGRYLQYLCPRLNKYSGLCGPTFLNGPRTSIAQSQFLDQTRTTFDGNRVEYSSTTVSFPF